MTSSLRCRVAALLSGAALLAMPTQASAASTTVAPAEIYDASLYGATLVPVTPGFTGTLSASAAGMVTGVLHEGTLTQPTGVSFPTAAPAVSAHTMKFTVTVPSGTLLARFALSNADAPTGTNLDLFVYRAGTLLGSSTAAAAQEQVDLTAPPAGAYDVYVDLRTLPQGVTSVQAKPYEWVLGQEPTGNLAVTASRQVTAGTTDRIAVAWAGLVAGNRYLGRINWSDGTTTVATTLVRVDGVARPDTGW